MPKRNRLAWRVRQAVLKTLPRRVANDLMFLERHGYWPTNDAPLTFNEKVRWRKLHENHANYAILVDKIRVKQFVEERLGPDWVIPNLWTGKYVSPQEQAAIAPPFVVKSNHGSGWNHFVKKNEKPNWPLINEHIRKWTESPWPRHLCEEFYNAFLRQALIEPWVGGSDDYVPDYKFFVFEGKVHFIQIDIDRFKNHRRAFFDRNWRMQEVEVEHPLPLVPPAAPKWLDRMIEAAEVLGADLSFVRVDFYALEDGPRFGEITLTPGAGLERFKPRAFDRVLGDLWTHPGSLQG